MRIFFYLNYILKALYRSYNKRSITIFETHFSDTESVSEKYVQVSGNYL